MEMINPVIRVCACLTASEFVVSLSLQRGSKYKSEFLSWIFHTNYFLLYKSLQCFLILRVKTALRLKTAYQCRFIDQSSYQIKRLDKDLSQCFQNWVGKHFLSTFSLSLNVIDITVGHTEVKWDEAKPNQKKHTDLTECWTMTSHPRVVYKRRETITDLPLYYSGELLKKHNKDKVRTKTGKYIFKKRKKREDWLGNKWWCFILQYRI